MGEIKILAISDLHWYTELAKIKNIDFDVCVLLGDIPVTAIRLIKAYTESKPVLAVAGNHDDWNTPELGGAENIHGQCVMLWIQVCRIFEFCPIQAWRLSHVYTA